MQKLLLFYLLGMVSCKENNSNTADAPGSRVRTPVTVTYVSYAPLQEFIELNATSSFLQKSFVKSNMIGYVKKVNIKLGDFVKAGQALFSLRTKESEAIGNSVNKLNPDFKFSGVNTISAKNAGFIAELNHQEGDYVQDGEQLAVISDLQSFAFVMNVPYEDMPYILIGKSVEIILPGEVHVAGKITASMPMMDSVSQTQSFLIKANNLHNIPQNLVATIKLLKVAKAVAATLPKGSVLGNETQSNFLVMKMINDSTAVSVPVKKGIETRDGVEILSPSFSPNDRILLTGNYGLPDTAQVIIQK
ncbi:MAG: efflux RND transporter periplasmic adaptor subunit [Ginsengibacter sp.]